MLITLGEVGRRRFLQHSVVPLGAMLAAPALFPLEAASSSSSRKLEAVLEKYFAAYQSMNVENVLPFLTDDILLVDPTFRIRVQGKPAVRQVFADVVNNYSGVTFEVENRLVCGDQAATQQTASGRFRTKADAPWKDFSFRGCTFFRFAGERISHWTDYYDVRTFQEQVGLKG